MSHHLFQPRYVPRKLFCIVFLIAFLSACAHFPTAQDRSTVVQVSTYPALAQGMYDGDLNYDQLRKIGDFGIGTFDAMDGEMIALDGKFYQAKVDGSVQQAAGTMECPFATVHFFHSDQQYALKTPLQNYEQLRVYLNQYLSATNRPYAFKITGTFAYLKLRSIPKQKEPFPLLKEVIAQQAVFELSNISGTLAGYWIPEYLAELNVPGYHLHFISDDKQHGGHMLECRLTEAAVAIDDLDSMLLLLPQTPAFQKAKLNKTQN